VIILKFTFHFHQYQVQPEINYPQCGKLLLERCANNEEKTICRIIELYFENEPANQVMHLPSILSSYTFNKYLPRVNLKVEEKFLNE
jgi:hypothetical protein